MSKPLRVIVNADDFGMNADTCLQTLACLRDGAVSSASIMPTMPATRTACEFARRHPEFSYGVHLTFLRDTCEAPAAPPHSIPTLVDEQGRFRDSNVVRARALVGRIAESDIAAETEAQLARVRDYGVTISHVDSHAHLHKFPVFRRALARVLPRFGVRRVRNQQNIHIGRAWRSPTWWLAKTWKPVASGPWRTTDWFFMPAGENFEDWPGWLLRVPRRGTLEVGVHPGADEPWRASERDQAYRLRELLSHHAIPMIPWREI